MERHDTLDIGVFEYNSTMDTLVLAYQDMLPTLKVRTVNVLRRWQNSFPNIKQFLKCLLKATYRDIAKREKCGRFTTDEILSLQKALNSIPNISTLIDTPQVQDTQVKPHKLPSNIDDLMPIIEGSITKLSSRSQNRIASLLKECDNSLSTFYERICDPHCIDSIPTIGRKSTPEIIDFFANTRQFLEQFLDEASISSCVQLYYTSTLGIPSESMATLHRQEKELGYFPIFAAIQTYLNNLSKDKKAIIHGCLNISKGQRLPDRKEIASELNLSSERVRQKRNNIILNELPQYFKRFRNLVVKNPYRYQMTHYEDDINAAEGTDFNLNFVTWVLGSIFDDLTIIGDPIKSIGGYFNSNQFLHLVPTALTKFIDFNGFVKEISDTMEGKRINDERRNIKILINTCLMQTSCKDVLPEIETTCRSILYLHFPVEIELNDVIFPANAYKTIPIIVEEILRAHGRPMTFEEINEEFTYKHPERNATEGSIKSATTLNKNIVPIGRSGTYTLSEWKTDTYRGGTIRQFVDEYLDSLTSPISTAEDIYAYVRKFRPNSSDSSISSNLLQEQNHKYVALTKDGVRYYGYANIDYGPNYKIISGGAHPRKRTLQESMSLLEEFILRNGRYPHNSETDEEERRLYRFVGNRRSVCSRKVASLEEIDEWQKFEKKYRNRIYGPTLFIEEDK